MTRMILPLILLVAVALFLFVACDKGLIRGVADEMLVSPARPSIAVRIAPPARLVDARRAEVLPAVADGSPARMSAEVFYALHERPAGSPQEAPARLLSLLATIGSPYRWRLDDTPPGADEYGRRPQRQAEFSRDGHPMLATTFLLRPEDDLWAGRYSDGQPWQKGSLVRRFTFLLFQQRAKLMVEYREPWPDQETELPLSDNLPALAAFEARADKAFSLMERNLPRPTGPLPYPPSTFSRQGLARWVGELWLTDGR